MLRDDKARTAVEGLHKARIGILVGFHFHAVCQRGLGSDAYLSYSFPKVLVFYLLQRRYSGCSFFLVSRLNCKCLARDFEYRLRCWRKVYNTHILSFSLESIVAR